MFQKQTSLLPDSLCHWPKEGKQGGGEAERGREEGKKEEEGGNGREGWRKGV